jgi:threonine synthase
MNYYSLNKKAAIVDFKEAAINGQAPDKGLYFPEHIPVFEKELIANIEQISNEELCYRVISPYVGNAIPEMVLRDIVAQTINFPIPLADVEPSIQALEMFHGNTLAFKDIGARFMSRCLGYFVKGDNRKVTVLVATSGDTGGAVADGFYGVEGIQVVILYPSGKVSSVQEKQLTTLGENIFALEVNGTFDDCQRMVKQAFTDEDLTQSLFLTSANSINVARWLPQQFFYVLAYKQWKEKDNPPVISVPSGNFGNICAGLLAMKSGLPVNHFIAACNANDVVPSFMHTREYMSKKSVATISNAMDVGDPSNFIRILEIFNHDFDALATCFSSVSISDEETQKAIYETEKNTGYLLDPHGAVGYLALKNYLQNHVNEKGFFAETAHPVKFYDVVEPVINKKILLPDAVSKIIEKEKIAVSIDADFKQLKSFLMSMNG